MISDYAPVEETNEYDDRDETELPNDSASDFSQEDYSFNERFQSLMSNYDAFATKFRDQKTITQLSDCNSDFTYAVET